MAALRIAAWNINGLAPNTHELEAVIIKNKLDVVLISESHATTRSSFRIKGFNIYATPHPDGRAHAGTALIIKSNLNYSVLEPYSTEFLQATTVRLEGRTGPTTLSAVYCPPKHKVTADMFCHFFCSLGHRFIAGGDWNAKHTHWGSRCTVTRGRELKSCVDKNRLQFFSTGEPTYWPSDHKKVPDLLDFFITKGTSLHHSCTESCLDGSSDHTPVILNLNSPVILRDKPESLHNYKTDWEGFKIYLESNLNLNIPLKSRKDVEEACIYLTNLIQKASWTNSPPLSASVKGPNHPLDIKEKILEKRRLRRVWHQSRYPADKTKFNRAAKELKVLLGDLSNSNINSNLLMMSPTGKRDYSLWKATRNLDHSQKQYPPIKSESTWARTDQEKAEAFAKHLASVFKPNDGSDDEPQLNDVIEQDLQLCLPIKPTSPKEIAKEIRSLDTKKSPGFDLITPKILKELPRKAVTFLACLFNAILRTSHFPSLWKVSQIIMIQKPGKPAHEPSSYRPISLTPVLSKLWERIFLTRLMTHMSECEMIPTHQFGFRKSHSTIEQVHRIYHTIRQSFENKQFCSAAFLDVHQAFDRVWHRGLLYKLKANLPHSLFPIIESYLSDRAFQVKLGDARSDIHPMEAGVPQGTVLGPVLYNIYTFDIPTTPDVTIATYADDIALLASDSDPAAASEKLQRALDNTSQWLRNWRIRTSAQKSNHVTFTLRKGNCPPVTLGEDTLPHSDKVKYLGFLLDRRLTWKAHIKQKRDQLNHKHKSLLWLMGRNSVLSLDNKLLIYKSILKPIWTYGIQLWSVACNTNIMCLQRAQNSILRKIANPPWFTRNEEIHEYLHMPTVKAETEKFKKRYIERLSAHPNPLAADLLARPREVSRLKRANIL